MAPNQANKVKRVTDFGSDGLPPLYTEPLTKSDNFKTTPWGGLSIRDVINVLKNYPAYFKHRYGGIYILQTRPGTMMLNYSTIRTAVERSINHEALRLFSHVMTIADSLLGGTAPPHVITVMSSHGHLLPFPFNPAQQSNGCVTQIPASSSFDGVSALDPSIMVSWHWIYEGVTDPLVAQPYVGAVAIVNRMLASAQLPLEIRGIKGLLSKASAAKKKQWHDAFDAFTFADPDWPLAYGAGFQVPPEKHALTEYVVCRS
jgi:hypothetical protein